MRSRYSALAVFLILILSSLASTQSAWPGSRWPTSTPDAVGLDAKKLAALDTEIASGKFGYVDSFLVIRHGKLVCDRSYKNDYDKIYGDEAKQQGALNPHDPSGPYNYFNTWWHPFYRRGDLHTMQSVTKTVTSVVIGVATARKEFPDMDTPVLKFFDESKVSNIDDRKRRMTVRHLLTMSDGLDWNESLPYSDPNNTAIAMEASSDWIEYTINRPMAREPGTVFNYNSGATELLAYIFRVATGKDIEEYAARYLFAPLGIENYFWKRTPSGLIDTEGGLYLRSHDLAKIAYLFLKQGLWEGKQIVTSDWVKASVAPSMTVSSTGVKYGLKWWLFPYGTDDQRLVWAGSGFGGQIPLIFADYDMVVVLTGWNILPVGSRIGHRVAIDRVLEAVVDKRPDTMKK